MGSSGSFIIILIIGMVFVTFLSWYLASSDKVLVALVPRARELEEKKVIQAQVLNELRSVDQQLMQRRDQQSRLEWREEKLGAEFEKLKLKADTLADIRSNIVYEYGNLDERAQGLMVKIAGPHNVYPFNGLGSRDNGDGYRNIDVLIWATDSNVALATLLRWRNLDMRLLDSRPWKFPSEPPAGTGANR